MLKAGRKNRKLSSRRFKPTWTSTTLVSKCQPSLQFRRKTEVASALHKKSDQSAIGGQYESANGAQYDSQGQARSASPLVCDTCKLRRPERPKYDTYYALSGLHGLLIFYPGATRFALASGYHIARRWRSDSCICTFCKTVAIPVRPNLSNMSRKNCHSRQLDSKL